MKLELYKSDQLGVLASTLCLIHCLATPLLFIAQTCSASCCEAAPAWWQWIDYIFLVISFAAVYRSARTTSRNFIKPILWISWGALFVMLVNKKLSWFPQPEYAIYIPAFALIITHLYNMKYCQCSNEACHANHS